VKIKKRGKIARGIKTENERVKIKKRGKMARGINSKRCKTG
jgi:hypothetical protein